MLHKLGIPMGKERVKPDDRLVVVEHSPEMERRIKEEQWRWECDYCHTEVELDGTQNWVQIRGEAITSWPAHKPPREKGDRPPRCQRDDDRSCLAGYDPDLFRTSLPPVKNLHAEVDGKKLQEGFCLMTMPSDPAPPSHYCKTCGYVVNWNAEYRGDTYVGGRWEHSAVVLREMHLPDWAKMAEHDPDPAPQEGASPSTVVTVCDFCSGAEPVWTYPANPFNAGTFIVEKEGEPRSQDYISADDWGACEQCHDDIVANRWGWIADRVVADVPREMRLVFRQSIKDLHAQFRQHRTGEPYRGH